MMDPPEWLQEGNSSQQKVPEPITSDDSNLPDWLKEATTDPPQKKPKKKLAYIAPTRRESSDRSSFSGPINDPVPPPTNVVNPRMSLLSGMSRPQATNVTNNLSPVSTPFGPTSIFSPQKTSTMYQSISMEDEPDQSIINGNHRHLHMKDEESGEDDTVSHLSSTQKNRQASAQAEDMDILVLWFRSFHLIAGLAATVSMVGNVYEVSQWSSIGLRNSIIHLYASVFSLVIVGIECEVPFLLHRLKLFDWWVVRGLMYIFVGALTIDPSNAESLVHQTVSDKNMKLTQNIAGIILSIVAVLYIVMGLLCMKALRDKKLAHLPPLGSESIII